MYYIVITKYISNLPYVVCLFSKSANGNNWSVNRLIYL